MKLVKPTIFLIIILPIYALSQNFWEKIDIPPNYTFSSLAVGNNNENIYLGSFKKNDTSWVFVTENDGITWNGIGLANSSIYSLLLNNEGNLLTGVNGHIFLYDFAQQSWSLKHSTSTNIVTINIGISNTIFAAGNTFNRSDDDGYNWEELVDMGQDAIYSIAVRSVDTVYIGETNFLGGGGVFRSVDGGETWENIGLVNHFITTLGINSSGDLFAGGIGQYEYGWGGIYKLPSGSVTWDTLFYWPRIKTIVITEEDVIYCGYWLSLEGFGGVMHSVDNGETWVIDTTGMGNVGISELVLDRNETLYALSSTTITSKLYRSVLPVGVNNSNTYENNLKTLCYPNPFKASTIISFQYPGNKIDQFLLKIYNISGNLILSKVLSNKEINQQKIFFKRGNLNSGMYIYIISCENYTCSGKFIIIN